MLIVIAPILLFICWSAISSNWADFSGSALHHTGVWSLYLIFYLCTAKLIFDNDSRIELLTGTASLCLAFYGCIAIFAYIAFVAFRTDTHVGTTYAKFGEQVNTIFPLALALSLGLSGRKFIAAVGVLAVLWLLVYCSLSRTNLALFFVCFAVMAATVFFFARFRPLSKRLVIIASVLILAPIPLQLATLFAEDPAGIAIISACL